MQAKSNASQRTPGATCAGKGIHLPAHLLPDFLRSGGAVAFPVCSIVKLVGPDPPVFFCQTARDMDIIAGVTVRFGRHKAQVCTDHAQETDFFPALRFGHDNNALITACIGDQC